MAKRIARYVLLGLALLAATPACAETLVLDESFILTPRPHPAGPAKPYPDPMEWSYTFWPGIVWPESYGNGTNWLENNGESQVYVSRDLVRVKATDIPPDQRFDPFEVDKAGLHIRAILMTPEQQRLYHVGGHRRFASGMLLSRKSILFGRVRVVAKLPSASGSWPQLWLVPENRDWPPEIDIFEAMPWGQHKQQLNAGIIGLASEGPLPPAAWIDLPSQPAEGFHEYGLDLTRETTTFYFDGKVIRTQPTPSSFHTRRLNLIVNLAVGAKWVYNELGIKPIDSKDPERLARGATAIERDYPAEMIVKSIKIWQE